MYIRALRATLNKTDHSFNSVSLPTSQLTSFVLIPAWLKVDTAYFRQINPNYARPQIDKSPGTLDLSAIFDFTEGSIERKDQIKRTDIDPTEMKDQDFLISSPTVLGFSLGDKLWRALSLLTRKRHLLTHHS